MTIEKVSVVLPTWRKEIKEYLEEMVDFPKEDLREVLVKLGGYSARAAFMRFQIGYMDDDRLTSFRTRQLDPFIAECDRQFKVWSRIQSLDAQEYQMMGRAT
jgi:hypothetical protein